MEATDVMKRWQTGNGFRADHLNEPVDWIKSHGDPISGRTINGNGSSIYTGSGGTAYTDFSEKLTGRWFWGKIVGFGPDNDADFTDMRYWVQGAYLDPKGSISTAPEFKDDASILGEVDDNATDEDNLKFIRITTAVNIAEMKDKSHFLSYGSYVQVFEVQERPSDDIGESSGSASDADSQAMFRWVFFSPDIGRPQYQFMVMQGVSQNERGWDYVRAHSMS